VLLANVVFFGFFFNFLSLQVARQPLVKFQDNSMAFLTDPEFWARWLGIVIIDLTLAGDNALVIALAVRTLPPRQQLWGRIGGTVGAVALRLLFIAIVSQLLRIPFLQAVGGLVLIWIALKLVRQGAGDGHGKVRQGTTLREAIWIIVVADAIMSLDNVLAVAAAAHGNLVLVIFGIALSIPIVVGCSGILARLMNRYEWIIWLGGGVLGWVAAEMIVKDQVVHRWVEPWGQVLHWLAPALLGATVTAVAWWMARRARGRLPAAALDGLPDQIAGAREGTTDEER
jgi:YjbE family integral membrane protein